MSLVLPRVIGHRGAPKRAPENTLAAFAEAKRLGSPWVELDVQLSRDLVPVVFHDDRLERTSNGEGLLIERDSAYLKQLDVGSWFGPEFKSERLPTFEAVLKLLIELKLGLNIEIKAEDDRGALTSEVGLVPALALWPADRQPPLVTSFSRNALGAAQKVAPNWPRGLVSHHWPADLAEMTAKFGLSTIHVAVESVSKARVAEAKTLGLEVAAYVVDEPKLAHQLWDLGVASLFSDRPDQLLSSAVTQTAD